MRTNTTRKAAPVTLPALPEPQILSWTHDKKMAVWMKDDATRHPYFLNLLLCLPLDAETEAAKGRKVQVTFAWVEE